MNQDDLAKERARRPANVGTKRVDAADALAQLDQRITQTRNECNGTADDAAKDLARHPTASAPGVYRVPPSARSELSHLENVVASKSVPRGSSATLQPGAYSVTEEKPSTGPATLRQLEADVASKTRAAALAPSTVRSLNQMEADVQAKERARSSRTGLSELESDIATKSVAHSRRSVDRTALRDLEDSEAKFRASGRSVSAVSRGARRELDQIEADISKKESERSSVSYSNISLPGVTHLRPDEVARLDERIAYKTGISMQHEELKEDNPANDVYNDNADAAILSKRKQSNVVGVRTETILSMLESAKYEAMANQNAMGYEVNMGDFDGDADDDDDAKGDKLAIAEPVDDDDDDIFIPAAIEYDPDAKPPIYKNRRFRLYGSLAGLLLFALVAGLAFGLLSGSDKAAALVNGGDGPTPSPTTYRESLGIQDQLELVVGSDKLNDPSTPHYQAMEWIIHEDKLQLTADDPNLVQRYLLALFYMQTTRSGDWISCGRPDDDDTSFCLWQKLIEVWPHEYVGIPWIRWLSGESECAWAGVLCDQFNTTRAIDLYGQNMTGTMPTELTLLPYLQTLGLSWNFFTGSIPPEFGEMKHLLQLEIHWNQFTGTIPASYYDSPSLIKLNLGGNALSGSLPADQISSLTEIKGFFVDENLLTGTIPTELGQLSLLSFGRFQRNFFNGTMPTEVGNLDNAAELWFHGTNLEGNIPEEVADMERLRDFRISQTGMSGAIPEGLYDLTNMERIELFNTKMSGTISSKIGQLVYLDVLRISDCRFTGALPTEMGLMIELKSVWLHGNNFIGQIPDEVCLLRGTHLLGELTADCLPSVAAVTCRSGCCTTCCDSETGACA